VARKIAQENPPTRVLKLCALVHKNIVELSRCYAVSTNSTLRENLLLSIAISLTGGAGVAQESKSPAYSEIFDKQEVMIAARDGNKLHTEIYTPKNAKELCPSFLCVHPTAFCRG